MSERSCFEVVLQPLKAFFAAATAISTSSLSESGTKEYTLPVDGL